MVLFCCDVGDSGLILKPVRPSPWGACKISVCISENVVLYQKYRLPRKKMKRRQIPAIIRSPKLSVLCHYGYMQTMIILNDNT